MNGARIAGLAAGALLGPDIMEAIRDHFRPKVAHPAAEVVPAAGAAEAAPVEGAAVEQHPPIELAKTLAEPELMDPRVLELAQIRKDDGFTQVISRQLEYRPQAFGFTGDSENQAEVHRWAMGEAKRLAQGAGFLGVDGRTTIHGLRAGSGSILLHPNGTIGVIGEPQTYAVNKPLGFEPKSEVARVWEELKGPEAVAERERQAALEELDRPLEASNEALLRGATERIGPPTRDEAELDAVLAQVEAPGDTHTADAEAATPAGVTASHEDAMRAVIAAREAADWQKNIRGIPRNWWDGVGGDKVWTSSDGKVTFAVGESIVTNVSAARTAAETRALTALLQRSGTAEGALRGATPIDTQVVDGKTYRIIAIPTASLPKRPS